MTKAEIVAFVPEETNQTTIEHEWQPPKLGSWWWVKGTFYKMVGKYSYAYDENDEHIYETQLACVTDLGSNYGEVSTPQKSHARIHFDKWDEFCEFEPDPHAHLQRKITGHQDRVRELLHEIQRVTAQLGIVNRDSIADTSAESSQALAAVSSAKNVNDHKKALIQAKDKTLPDLFKLVKEEHEQMAVWMEAELLPHEAELTRMKGLTGQIKDRLFTVELYAGLSENVTQIVDGKPADNDTPIHLLQERHYMDEECLINYQAGGMNFASIGEFDRWLAKPEHRARLLPHERCVVAFRVRRYDRKNDFEGGSISEFIRFIFDDMYERDANKWTFLYIRNGEQLYRMDTSIEFGAELFPDIDQDLLFNDQAAWIESPGNLDQPRSQSSYEHAWAYYHEKRRILAQRLWAWKRAGEPHDPWTLDARAVEKIKAIDPTYFDHPNPDYHKREHRKPGSHPFGGNYPEPPKYEPLTKDSVHYDDAMGKISDAAKEHNRVAVVLQGLLDRSPVFQPHPPWRLWTAEGFSRAIRLVYDATRVITTGREAPDFEAYRAQLNQSLKSGSITVGQQEVWEHIEAEKYNKRLDRKYDRHGNGRERERYSPYGNPGPGRLATVKMMKRGGGLLYTWVRSRKTPRSWHDGSFPTQVVIPMNKVLNVSAYTRGDFRMFFDDPRTRANYIKWAPYLLAAEDYASGKITPINRTYGSYDVDHDDEDTRAEAEHDRRQKEKE